MRIAVISDMHGNDLALEAAIKNQSWITSSVLKTRCRVDRSLQESSCAG